MISTLISEIRDLVEAAHHWHRIDREQARRRLVAARNRIDRALAELGGP